MMAAMPGPSEVVVVSHDASRTGAPILALQWVRWAAAHGHPVRVVIERDGPLRNAFENTCPTRTHGPGRHLASRITSTWARPSGGMGARGPVVVANTVAAWAGAAQVRRRSRLVLWAHELDHVVERVVPDDLRRRLLAVTDHVVAEGDRVAEMVTSRWHVPDERVSVVDSFLDDGPPPVAAEGADLDVVGVGSLTWRKGPDAFAAVVAELRRHRPEVRAAWIGGPLDSEVAGLVQADPAAAPDAPDAPVHLAGEVDDVGPWLPSGGVLVHPAREDPSPVAVLEAARAAVPVVTWDTGGAADLLRSAGLGHLVAPPGDVLGLARRVDALLADRRARDEAGLALQAAAAARTTSVAGPLLLAAFLGRGQAAVGGAR
jgi:glycosyltransferase involved in cell wall biosynthesis